MPRTDYSYHVVSGIGASDSMLIGNLDSSDTTTPAHRLELAYPISASNGVTVFQRETLPNSFLNGRLRIFYKITSRSGTELRISLIFRSSLPTPQTFYMVHLVSLSAGTEVRIVKIVNGTGILIASNTLSATLSIGKGTLMAEVVGSPIATIKGFANIVPLTDPDANAYISSPPLIVSTTDGSITTAGKFGFALTAVNASGAVEIDRLHIFEIT
jgi:hypothetical protein